jgi:hypothetical protein
MRSIIRWSLGPVRKAGLETLRLSVGMAKRLFPDFDFLIYHNQLEKHHLDFIKTLGVELLDCNEATAILKPTPGYNVHWKLLPPRVRPEAHEIVLDNDVLLRRIPKPMSLFLESDGHALVCEGLHHLFGSFDQSLPRDVHINSGIFGLPPGFDFENKCREAAATIGLKKWTNWFDEQGMVAAVLSGMPHYTIPLSSVAIIEPTGRIRDCDGYHFVHVNYKDHPAWQQFKGSLLV